MLIRVGPNRGFNMDHLLAWTYTPAPEPDPAPETEPTPEAPPGGIPLSDLQTEPPATSTTEELPPPEGTSTLTLTFSNGDVTLEGEEADKLNTYLLGKLSAAV